MSRGAAARGDNARMPIEARALAAWTAAWLLLTLVGATLLVRLDIAARRADFAADAADVHRLIGQRAAQHDAILATLALLDAADVAATGDRPWARLPALYPQLLDVVRSDAAHAWPVRGLDDAEAASRALPAARRHAVLGPVDVRAARYWLVLAGSTASYALLVDARRMAADDTPLQRDATVRAALHHPAGLLVLQPGPPPAQRPQGLTAGFTFAQALATASQPFELRLQRATGPAEWPWARLLAWSLASAAGVAALAQWRSARAERRRGATLARLAQAGRLNALGELAAGLSHELNQPLTATLASTQTALRVLRDDGTARVDSDDLATAREALRLAAAQARRASDVLARLRRLVQPARPDAPRRPVSLHAVARELLDLLAPELRRRGVTVELRGTAPPVRADNVALEQIVHNLMDNAVHALERIDAARTIVVTLDHDDRRARLSVRDNGPGIADDALPRLFEPFFTTRRDGLGLGLPLCESLAQAMDGTLAARNVAPRGAEFVLSLPLAGTAA